MRPTQDLRVKETVRLLTPRAIKAEVPMSQAANKTVVSSREQIARILQREDPRFLVVVGPCSIHDTAAAFEYASRSGAADAYSSISVKRAPSSATTSSRQKSVPSGTELAIRT